jgi:hypothetical protein
MKVPSLGSGGNQIVNRQARGGGNSNCRWQGILIVADHAEMSCVLTGDTGKFGALLAWALPYALIPAISEINAAIEKREYAYRMCASYCNGIALKTLNRTINEGQCIASMRMNAPLPEAIQQFAEEEIARQSHKT